MKCHYITDPKAGKVLIPGCMGSAVHGSIDFCSCPKGSYDRVTLLEKRIEKLEKIIKNTLKS